MLEKDETDSPLTGLTVTEFVNSVSSRTAVPGGGSVSALVASLVSAVLILVLVHSVGY